MAILFANGSPLKVVARSPVFEDAELVSPTTLVLLKEEYLALLLDIDCLEVRHKCSHKFDFKK